MIRETRSEVEKGKEGRDGLVVWEVSLRGGQVRKFMHLAVAPNLTFHMSSGCGFEGRNKWSTTGAQSSLVRCSHFATGNHVEFAIRVDGRPVTDSNFANLQLLLMRFRRM